MRQPLRYQIMFPMLGLMLTALVGVSVLNAYLAASRVRQHIERQLGEMTRTLDQSSFPLTDAVLRQMRGLSGAEFVLVGESGQVLASSTDRVVLNQLPRDPLGQPDMVLRQRLWLGGENYLHTARRLSRKNDNSAVGVLHILYPEEGYREAWTGAVLPPLGIGVAAALLVVLSAIAVAARVSRPMSRLQTQVDRIAQGDFEPMPLPKRSDEIRDLAQAINQMAAMLGQYEREVRRTERLRTLAQLGGGIAHQMRNAATGCRMAIDILAAEQSLPADSESLTVARRQLELMEKYLQRFLAVGKPAMASRHQPNDLGALVEELLPLVRPAARHAGVQLQWQPPDAPVIVLGDCEGLEQLIINLLLNGIEAAAQGPGEARLVSVCLAGKDADQVELVVQDSGLGPCDGVKDNLFDPFVTAKADGVGLGLSVARQVVEQHGGRITWDHEPGATRFRVKLPNWITETRCVELAGR